MLFRFVLIFVEIASALHINKKLDFTRPIRTHSNVRSDRGKESKENARTKNRGALRSSLSASEKEEARKKGLIGYLCHNPKEPYQDSYFFSVADSSF